MLCPAVFLKNIAKVVLFKLFHSKNFLDLILYTHIDQTLVNSLQELLNYEISELDCHVITTE